MKITIQENSLCGETEVSIQCREANEEVLRILATLRAFDKKLMGTKDGKTFIIEAPKVLYCESVDKKTFLYTQDEVYETSLRLYELEERLSSVSFFRASKSVIININKIKSLKPDFGGKLDVTMVTGEKLSVSRQYTQNLKQKLGI